jgi:hypothetical protein
MSMPDEYPNDGSTYYALSEPENQKQEASDEKAKVMPALEFIEIAISRLEERIKHYQSVNAIEVDIDTKPDEFMHAYKAAQLTVTNLTQEKDYYVGLRDKYKK